MRDLIAANGAMASAIGGLLIGFAFGWIVFRTNFCTMGSISDLMNFDDWRRFRAWILAATTTLIGAQVLQGLGVVELAKSMYLAPSLDWLGAVAGGLMFGFGMVFAGGCASRNLARAGSGDLRSLLVLIVLGIFAYMTIGGLLGPIRAELQAWTAIDLSRLGLATNGIGDIVARLTGIARSQAGWLVTLLVAVAALAYCFKDAAFRASPVHVWSGVGIGLCATAGWALTGLAYDELAARPVAPVSLTFVRPTGDTLEWLQRFTAIRLPGFGVATTLGALAGALAASLAAGRFHLATFADARDTLRNLLGAALMGIGGVLALGCTIGQGITGISTLSLASFLTFAAIVAGSVLGMKRLEAILMREA